MVKHVKAILIKTVALSLICWIVLTMFNEISTMHSIIAACIVSLVIYVMGDLVILRKFGNFAATLADMGTAFLILWIYLTVVGYDSVIIESFLATFLIGIFEVGFHRYLFSAGVVPKDERAMP